MNAKDRATAYLDAVHARRDELRYQLADEGAVRAYVQRVHGPKGAEVFRRRLATHRARQAEAEAHLYGDLELPGAELDDTLFVLAALEVWPAHKDGSPEFAAEVERQSNAGLLATAASTRAELTDRSYGTKNIRFIERR